MDYASKEDVEFPNISEIKKEERFRERMRRQWLAYYYDRSEDPLLWQKGQIKHYYPSMDVDNMTPFDIIKWANLAEIQMRSAELLPYATNEEDEIAESAFKEFSEQ